MKFEKKRLGDIAQIIGGGTPSTKVSEYWDGDIAWLTPKDLSSFDGIYVARGSRSVTEAGLAASSAKMLPKASVLYTSRAPIGYVAIAEGAISTNQGFKSLVLKEGYVPEFLFYLLKASKTEIESHASGGTFAEISAKAFSDVELYFPPTKYQSKVADILLGLDEKIQTNKQLSKTLEDIAQTIFKSWFIDFDPVKAKMAGEKPVGMDAATAALFPDSMEDSELGFIPTAWAVRELGDVLLTIESGKRPKGGSQSSGVPSLGAESIRGLGEFDFSSTKFIPHVFYAGMPTGKVKPFDVLIYKDGAGAGSYVSMFGGNFPFAEYAINEHVFLLRANQIPQSYLYFWMNLDSQKRLMVELAQKSAQPGLNQKDMKSISTLVPSTEILNTFDNLMKPFIAQIMSNSAENQTLSKIRDALLPRLISGELQIPEEMLTS